MTDNLETMLTFWLIIKTNNVSTDLKNIILIGAYRDLRRRAITREGTSGQTTTFTRSNIRTRKELALIFF